MLAELHIDNLLLIASARIEFSMGFNALTGETGAGKSLLLDALNFIIGARGDAGMVRPGAAQAEVSARFLLSDRELTGFFSDELGIVFENAEAGAKSPAELVLSRTLPRAGRARAYANGRPVALSALRELGRRLLDIHGQHENQSLLRSTTRLEILDRFAEASADRAAVRRCHGETIEAASALAGLRAAARDRLGREDLLRFQLKELDDAELDSLEPAVLEGELRLLRGAEKIREAADAVATLLDAEDGGDSAATLIARAAKHFSALGDAGPDAEGLRARLESLLAEARETSRDAGVLSEKARSDPERLEELEDRRVRLKTLERKYGCDLAGLIGLREKLRDSLGELQRLDVRTEEREKQLASAIESLRHACEKLSKKRKAAARSLEKQVNAELADLGLKGARLQILLTAATESERAQEPEDGADAAVVRETMPARSESDEARRMIPANLKSTGAEGIDIIFSANPEIPARPLKECASGGEISRVMLALKGVLARVSGADRLPVVIFDEIDSGVGGRLGAVLGRKLSELSAVRQVLCVTHQPQLAAFARTQFKVDKHHEGKSTAVRVLRLEGEDRLDELAAMLRGSGASAHTRAEAAAMLAEAGNK